MLKVRIYHKPFLATNPTKLKQTHESEIKKLRLDGENTSTKYTAELNSIMSERDSTKQEVN